MEQKKPIITLIAIVIALFVGYSLFSSFGLGGSYGNQSYEIDDSAFVASPNLLDFYDQGPGKVIRAGEIRLSEIGFVVIYEVRNGRIINKLGQSLLLPPGDYRNIQIDLDREAESGMTLSAVLYHDNGDGVFTTAVDVPVTDSKRNTIAVQFSIKD